jgi:FKBP-type peptidyl-prolyl cis-trans isomerase FkpA
MKSSNTTLAAATCALALAVAGNAAAADTPIELKTEKEQVSYRIGMDVGNSLKPVAGEIDMAILKRAIDDVLTGKPPALDDAKAQQVMQAFSQKMQAKQQAAAEALGKQNLAAETAFLAENGKKTGVVTTASGLQYQVLTAGSGAKPTAEAFVRVHYTGTLLDGTKFDSSVDRGEPTEFGVGQVIPGWIEGLQLMPVGSKYRFWIPAKLAYGTQGTPGGPIGPNAMLTFEVELLGIL